MRRPLAIHSALAAVLLLAGCPDDDDEARRCTPEVEKRAVAGLLYDWYLYPELLPPSVDPSQFASTAALMDAMTAEARAQDKDRGWSYVTTASANRALFDEGTAVGFGLGLLERTIESVPRIFVKEVYAGSAAAGAGFRRGDEILRIGETAEALVAVTPQNLASLLGPPTAGVTRVFEVVRRGETARSVTPPATKGTFLLDPVPVVGAGTRWKLLPREGKPPVGYVALRTFIRPAEAPLVEAFRAFRAAGATDVVVDLRYNGGGLVDTGELLANLLGGGLLGQVMSTIEFNPAHHALDQTMPFLPHAEAVTPTNVVFITTDGSASASELVPNALEPHRQVALVGGRTHGKPVGQSGFRVQGCDAVVFVVAFRLENSQGDGAYFGGLPDPATWQQDDFCEAPDDLAHDLGDPAEASLARALAWLAAGPGTCPVAAPSAKLGLSVAAAAPDRYPAPEEPTLAQRHVTGLF